jgi:hypothetical protein
MKIELEKPGTQASTVETAAAEHADNALPLKKDVAALTPEMLTPPMIALMNSQIKTVVGEIFEKLIPTLERINAPSPLEAEQAETLAAQKARFKREKQDMMLRDDETRLALAVKQRNCPHRDGNEKSAISTIHNFPDRQARGICVRCNLMITPKEYRVAPPSVKTMAQAKEFIAYLEKTEGVHGVTAYEDQKTHSITHLIFPEHRLYYLVREAEARQGVA